MRRSISGQQVVDVTYENGNGTIKQINQYKELCLVGEGSFSKVFLGLDVNTNKYYAIKRINLKTFVRSSMGIHQLEREIEIMRQIKNKYVVQLHEVIHVPERDVVYLIVDYANCGNLDQLIKSKVKLKPQEICALFRQIAEGVMFLHQHNIVHQDLKPANILLKSDGTILISDFGIGRSFQSAATVVGTPAYQSPEVVDCEYDEEEEIDPCKEDVWSLGVTLYQLAFNKLPFTGNNVFEIVRSIESSVLNKPEGADDVLWDLILHMLVVHPSRRYSIFDVINHPYTKSADLKFAPKCPAFTVPEVNSDAPIQHIQGIVCDKDYKFQNSEANVKPNLPLFAAPFQ